MTGVQTCALPISFGKRPKFVRPYVDAGAAIGQAIERYVADVRSGTFPGDEESYHLPAGEGEKMLLAAPRPRG